MKWIVHQLVQNPEQYDRDAGEFNYHSGIWMGSLAVAGALTYAGLEAADSKALLAPAAVAGGVAIKNFIHAGFDAIQLWSNFK